MNKTARHTIMNEKPPSADTSTMKLYFAYGSNLSSTQMARRCPNSVAVGLGWLSGWVWIINERHYANIVRSEKNSSREDNGSTDHPGVYGVLYQLAPDDEETLDLCEGVPWAYEKVVLKVQKQDENGNEVELVDTLVYVDFQNVKPDTPKTEYVGRMSKGVKESHDRWGFPIWFADKVMRRHIPGLEW